MTLNSHIFIASCISCMNGGFTRDNGHVNDKLLNDDDDDDDDDDDVAYAEK